MKREINPLLSIKDEYKKIIITMLNHKSCLQEGIGEIDTLDQLNIVRNKSVIIL